MSIKLATHLYRNRHGMFYFRFVIPQDLRPLLGRKPPIHPPTTANRAYASLLLFQGDERWRHGKVQNIGKRR